MWRVPLNSVVVFVAILFFCAPAWAQIDKVFFAGYSFASDAIDVSLRFPYSMQINNETDASGISVLEAELSRRVRANMPNAFELDFGLANTTGEVTLAFALDYENVSIIKIQDVYKVTIDLQAQILAFDFAEKKIIAAYPVNVQLRVGGETKPSESDIKQRIRELYLTNKHQLNIFDEFIKRLNSVKISAKYRNYIQVVSVDLTDRAAKKVAEMSSLSLGEFQGFVGQQFTKFLSSNQNIGVLPYTKGQSIGGKMAARFADGKVFNLTIPEPDYHIKIGYTGFGKKMWDKNNVEEAWKYVTGFHLNVSEPLSGRTYLDEDFRGDVDVKYVTGGQQEADHWSAYKEAFLGLSENLTKQTSTRSFDWVKKHSNSKTKERTKEVLEQLENFEKVIEKCR